VIEIALGFHIAAVELDLLDSKEEADADPNLFDAGADSGHSLGPSDDAEEAHGEPSGTDRSDIEVDVPPSGAASSQRAHDRPEAEQT
jgi:hypothetical protein